MERDEERFQRLYQQNHRPVYFFLRRRTDPDSALEVTADTFAVAWRRMADVPQGDAARSWLYGVAWRQLANRHRKVRRVGALKGKMARVRPEPPETPESVAIRHEEGEQVRMALGRLRPKDQEVLRLATWEDLTHAEIASVMGCSRHAVDQRIHRATRRLARELERSGATEPERVAPAGTGGVS